MKKKFPDHPEVLEGSFRMMSRNRTGSNVLSLKEDYEEFPKNFEKVFSWQTHWTSKKAFQHDQRIFRIGTLVTWNLLFPKSNYTLQTERSNYSVPEEYEKISWNFLKWETKPPSFGRNFSEQKKFYCPGQSQADPEFEKLIPIFSMSAHYLRMKSYSRLIRLKWPDGNTPELQHALNILSSEGKTRTGNALPPQRMVAEKRLFNSSRKHEIFESSPAGNESEHMTTSLIRSIGYDSRHHFLNNALHQTQSLVLKTTSYRDKDLVVHFLTKEFGKTEIFTALAVNVQFTGYVEPSAF